MQAFIKNKYSNKKSSILKDCAWWYALTLLEKSEATQQKFGDFLKQIPNNHQLYTKCRSLVLNVLKHRTFLRFCLEQKLKRHTKSLIKNFLLIAAGDLLQHFIDKTNTENIEKIFAVNANAWVEKAKILFSKQECNFVNAILRAIYDSLNKINNNSLPKEILYSTPKWLINRWELEYGKENAEQLLKLNQLNNTSYIRLLDKSIEQQCDFLQKTQFENFYKASNNQWHRVQELLSTGLAYVQDPMTIHPVKLLDVNPNMSIMDLCAAPGGKSVQIAEKLHGTGFLLSVDLPSKRINNLYSNLKNFQNVKILELDILQLSKTFLSQQNLPAEFDRVLIDVPCSNTGVIRRKPDVKFRLQPENITTLQLTQLQLLSIASSFLKKNGILVYSTCSIEPDENQNVVNLFLKNNPNFSLINQYISLPWQDQCDGGASFALKNFE